MHHASEKDIITIKEFFKTHKDVFPHVRFDYLKRSIKNNRIIFEDGVIIIYRVYKRRTKLGNVVAEMGSACIHQIVSNKGNGSEVLNRFFEYVNTNVYLTVRSENIRAKMFYEKNGMKKIGDIDWANNTILGEVWKYEI